MGQEPAFGRAPDVQLLRGSASASRRLVAGPGVAICQDCAAAAMELFSRKEESPAGLPGRE